MITTYLTGDKVTSSDSESFSLFDKSLYGEKINRKIVYTPIEAIFLLQEEKIKVFSGKKQLTSEELIKVFKKYDKKIETKVTVYSDLRKKGYIVKSALKFGAEFRVYDKGSRPGTSHARWILYTTKEHENIDWHDFSAKNRVAHSTKKNLIVALVDQESDVTYYEISWLKP